MTSRREKKWTDGGERKVRQWEINSAGRGDNLSDSLIGDKIRKNKKKSRAVRILETDKT